MSLLEQIRRIAEVEFAVIVVQTDILGAKLRVLLADDSYVDVWVSRNERAVWFPLGASTPRSRVHGIRAAGNEQVTLGVTHPGFPMTPDCRRRHSPV